ncbi:hypothetical protein HNQ71_006896 [Mesorhizobium sangaii]|uniref:Uncharacterized protein n=1 Tax=Mesorhizobium sangaii TaxID=505389 RepID=A0A841PG73_9HYPH|nr:hypothetical protein [Mesorhizobium sangaii]
MFSAAVRFRTGIIRASRRFRAADQWPLGAFPGGDDCTIDRLRTRTARGIPTPIRRHSAALQHAGILLRRHAHGHSCHLGRPRSVGGHRRLHCRLLVVLVRSRGLLFCSLQGPFPCGWLVDLWADLARPKPSPPAFFPAACGGFLAPLRFKKAARSGPSLPLRPGRVQAGRTRPSRSAIAGEWSPATAKRRLPNDRDRLRQQAG